jgi:hypothetical protein
MKIFQCGNCGMAAYFDNTVCVRCGWRLGYDPAAGAMTAVRQQGDAWMDAQGYARRFCANASWDACNWLVADDDSAKPFCIGCRHNRTVPDLSQPNDLENWRRLEAAKRHLFYSLLNWRLPMPDREEEPRHGLAFDFLADVVKEDGTIETVLTGHDEGLITINIAEGDDVERERRRTQLREPYRTLLGHFRHEVGHYYWDVLVRDRDRLDDFRAIFGDEREDYAAALARHYDAGPVQGWQQGFISSYAAAHPWEDFAETWAHYLHIVDTLETAEAFHLKVGDPGGVAPHHFTDPYSVSDVRSLLAAWVPLTVAMNAVNRSMGQPEFYPFVLSAPVTAKLQFVCDVILKD